MTRILIVDDHEIVRDGIRKMLDEQPGAVTFGQAGTAAEALDLARDEEWDVAVLDLSLGGRSGLEVLKDLKQIRPKLPILILSMHAEEHYARRAFKGGAAGYITKDSPRAELLHAIKTVIKGGKYVSSALANKLVFDIERGSDRPPHEDLSDREFEVIKLIGSGKTVTEIAALLSLSDKTISTYRARILQKLQMKTSAELTRYAIENKLVD
jgi:DNA-binding NarL/FixJ family response regulator